MTADSIWHDHRSRLHGDAKRPSTSIHWCGPMGMSIRSPSTANSTGGTSPGLILRADATGRKQRSPRRTPRPSVSSKRTRKPAEQGAGSCRTVCSRRQRLPMRGQHVAAIEMEQPTGGRRRPGLIRQHKRRRHEPQRRGHRMRHVDADPQAGTTARSRLASPAACRAAVRTGDGKAARPPAKSCAACRGGCPRSAAIRTAQAPSAGWPCSRCGIRWRPRLSRRIGPHSTNPTGWGPVAVRSSNSIWSSIMRLPRHTRVVC